MKLENGQICQSDTNIISEQDCIAAAVLLDLSWGDSWDGPDDFPGCLFADDGRSLVYFNLSPNPATSNFNYKYAGICIQSDNRTGNV